MSNGTKRDVTRDDESLTFTVKCASVDDKQALFDAINDGNIVVETFVYRGEYNASNATNVRARGTMLRMFGAIALANAITDATRKSLSTIAGNDEVDDVLRDVARRVVAMKSDEVKNAQNALREVIE